MPAKVARYMSNSSLVLNSSFVTTASLLTSIVYGGRTGPSILYTNDAVGSFLILAAYLKIYPIISVVMIVHRTTRWVNPSIQLMPAALEAMIVENGFENAAIPPSDVPPKMMANGTRRS